MGEVFAGRYELIDLVGEGGMGTVWRVWDRATGTVVAAKVLRHSESASLLRFVREQSFRIEDEHVLTPIGWAGEDDKVLFTMPLVAGGSLAHLIGDFGALPPLFVAEVLRQVLTGLAAVHKRSIVHRDIKPANILLDPTGTARPHARITDFGIAVDLRAPRWTETGVVSGTPGYLAPELIERGEVSPGVDLYAAGRVALAMLTGVKPGQGVPVSRPVGVPDALWSVVLALSCDDPAGRPGGAATARARLEVPELAWRPAAIGEVEVFDHLADRTLARWPVPDQRQPVLSEPPAVPQTSTTTTGAPTGAPPVQRTGGVTPRDVVVGAILLVMLVVGGVLLWSPWA